VSKTSIYRLQYINAVYTTLFLEKEKPLYVIVQRRAWCEHDHGNVSVVSSTSYRTGDRQGPTSVETQSV